MVIYIALPLFWTTGSITYTQICYSQLLQQLDVASEEDPVLIEEAVLDKGKVISHLWQYSAFSVVKN